MTTLFCVRPATRNIGNDIIHQATADLLLEAFGTDTNIVNIPALVGSQNGGLTARQVYDMNRLADGVVIGGGNLFENGQLTVDDQALGALRRPMMLIGLSHGRIYSRDGSLVYRSDSLPARTIGRLIEASVVAMVRDTATQRILETMSLPPVEVGGCPTLFMAPTPTDSRRNGRVLLSVREPSRMSIPPALQWRVPEDVRRLIAALQRQYGQSVYLVCHDYADLQFAAAFPEAPALYFDNVRQYIDNLRHCRLSVSYRLHAFLPCLAFGTPSIHLSYDERGREMLSTIGMGDWDIDITREADVVSAVEARIRGIGQYAVLRSNSSTIVTSLQETTKAGLSRFVAAVAPPAK